MSAYTNFLNDLTNKSTLLYPEFKNQIKWVNYYEALEKEEEKNLLINKLADKLKWSFKNTKPWINKLSKGCQLCGEGEWSCLFITGKCNANCFYCPAVQNNDGVPSTQLTSFEHVDDYIQYLDFFGFKGASLSGGEPLLVFDRTLHYIKHIRHAFGDNIYLWIYTNGILGSEEIYKQLANAGIDEVRFDIGATNYNLNYLKLAKGIIPNITVEIPAVPGEFENLKSMIPNLIDLGVKNINLHQLRLTNYNATKLLTKDYTFLHGEQATILESELCALRIIEFVADNMLDIGINYCAFNFKNRFQKAGFRKKIAAKFLPANAQLTENGYLRNISDEKINYNIENNTIIDIINNTANKDYSSLNFSYKGFILDDHIENKNCLEKIIIGDKAYFLRNGTMQNSIKLNHEQVVDFLQLFNNNGLSIPDDNDLFNLWKYEFIEYGIRSYF